MAQAPKPALDALLEALLGSGAAHLLERVSVAPALRSPSALDAMRASSS